MSSALSATIFFLWLASALIDYSEFCYLWQLKEYRIDRFRDFLASEQGKRYWLKYSMLWRSCLAIIVFFIPFNNSALLSYFIGAIFFADLCYLVYKKLTHTLRRPVFTVKAAAIILTAIAIEGVLFLGAHDLASLLFLLIIRFFIIAVAVAFYSFPTRLYKHIQIERAKRKLAAFPHLKKIGITGSYGKSSTKEFLAHILEGQFRVAKTPKNINTEIGVAQFILRTDFSDIDIFVVEMGAYQKGEIALLCDMVRPQYGILTVIAEEHLALFGSIKRIQETKYELLRALPSTGFAVTNADNAYCREYLEQLTVPVETFGYDREYHPTALVTEYKAKDRAITFSLDVAGTAYAFFAPVVGEHNTLNIAAALLMAHHLGLGLDAIQKRVESLRAEHGIIKTYEYGKATIIDDTYNANPTGFRAALTVLSSYSSNKKRIVVTRGMLELGELSDVKHEEIGGEIAFVADELVIITPDAADAIKRGVVSKYRTAVKDIYVAEELLAYMKEKKEEDCVILFENRIPQVVLQEVRGKE